MNKYELAVVVSAKVEDDVRSATVEKAKELVTRFGGVLTEVEDWGKTRLAYYFIQFEADSTCPAEVEKRIRIMDNVIRYLCIRKDAK